MNKDTKAAVPVLTEVLWNGNYAEADGLFIYQDYAAGEESLKHFLADFYASSVSFEDCIGAYRITLKDAAGKTVYFGDNSGEMFFFWNRSKNLFTYRLQDSCPAKERSINYDAAAQFLVLGCIYGHDTLIQGVSRTDPESYYEVENGKVCIKSKHLKPIRELPYDSNALETLMKRVTKAIENRYRLGCSITGGVDSRAVLAHLRANGQQPHLSITGHESNVDVQIAKTIADILNEKLDIYSPQPDSELWLEEMLDAADGTTSPVGAYRLYKEAKGLRQQGIEIKFGGGAGELYKNSFLNQDYPHYDGAPDWNRFLRMKVMVSNIPEAVWDNSFREKIRQLPTRYLDQLQKYSHFRKDWAYLDAGYQIMQGRLETVVNMQSPWYVPYSPLMERSVAAWSYHQKPKTLELQRFQREEVTKFCPEIKGVQTDRGLTCDIKKRRQESVKSYLFLIRVAMGRILKHKAGNPADDNMRWARETNIYKSAVKSCKETGILSGSVCDDQIPDILADRILTVGFMFNRDFEGNDR